MTHLLGLTGSIGMGKSTTAQMFRDAGVPVWDADATVHDLYATGGAAVALIGAVWPQAVVDNAVSRDILKQIIANKPATLHKIEYIVHPLVAASRRAFIAAHDDPLLVFDIPLLFETSADKWLTSVLVVTAPPDLQKLRVMARPGMTDAQFAAILSRQTPDAEKRARADYLIETRTLDGTRAAVQDLIADLKGQTDA
ncbi:dephospho-CoA kinase [Yoonia sp.]|uniref:dephospho-CoA kinase n=1 Tax=Yoonia sp. TaxID=2212373 RepID=UPI0025E042D9|nr:dephospho-CoA kinase [Yoonia sp.]